MALDFPFDAFVQAAKQKNQNRQDMYGNIEGIGQGLGSGMGAIAGLIKKQKDQQTLAQIVAKMRAQGQPQQGPQMPGVGIASGQMPPASGFGAPSPDQSGDIMGLSLALDPTGALMKNIATAERYMGGLKNKPTSGKRTVYEAPDGTVSLIPSEGATPLEVGDDRALTYTAVGKSKPAEVERADAYKTFAEARKKGVDLQAAITLSKTTNPAVAGGGTLLGKLAMTNLRSDRNITMLSQGPVTYQILGNALTDIAGAYQGGVPHIQQYMDQKYPGYMEKVAYYKSLVTNNPQAIVPKPIQDEVLRISKELKTIDNIYMRQNAKTQIGLLGDFVTPGQRNAATSGVERFIQGSQGQPNANPGQVGGSGGWSPKREQRLQELLRKQKSGTLGN